MSTSISNSMHAGKPFVGIDWGTTSFRLMAFDGAGALLTVKTAADGLGKLTRAEIFATLRAALVEFSGQPVVMCGMVGSTIGLIEVPYLDCPLTTERLAKGLVKVESGMPDFQQELYIVPGVRYVDNQHVDVMRGEEAQVMGWLSCHPEHRVGRHHLCLPGTHSKWVTVDNASIVSIQTALTGELFAILGHHSVLINGDQQWSEDEFAAGVKFAMQGEGLLKQLFSTRARVVAANRQAQFASSYLSGLLLGTELQEMSAGLRGIELHIVGNEQLIQRYQMAAEIFCQASSASGKSTIKGTRSWDGGDMVAQGLNQIWSVHV